VEGDVLDSGIDVLLKMFRGFPVYLVIVLSTEQKVPDPGLVRRGGVDLCGGTPRRGRLIRHKNSLM
jgi:hypothetical protein